MGRIFQGGRRRVNSALVALEVLDGALVLFGGGARGESAEVAALAGPWVFLARIEPVLTGFELSDHAKETAGKRRRFRGREPGRKLFRLISMTRILPGVLTLFILASSIEAEACDGPAGSSVAITYDGQKFTVTDVGRQSVNIVFTTANNTYNLQLAPGQSDSPGSSGMFGQPMSGYQACTATPVRYR